MKLKNKDGEEFTGEIKGSVFAVWNSKKENVGNFTSAEDACKLGGYRVVSEAAPASDTPPAGGDNAPQGESAKTGSDAKPEAGSDAAPKDNAVPRGDAAPQGEQAGQTASDKKPETTPA